MYIVNYFHRIEEIISNCPAIISKEILYEQRTKHIGFIKGILIFKDSSELHFKEFVDVEIDIVKYKYGYHYQKEDKLIFRYDNHPYPAKKDIPPHHKHHLDENTILSTSPPDLESVLKEILLSLP